MDLTFRILICKETKNGQNHRLVISSNKILNRYVFSEQNFNLKIFKTVENGLLLAGDAKINFFPLISIYDNVMNVIVPWARYAFL